MALLAGISGKDTIRKLQHVGYVIVRQKGSHVRLKHPHDAYRRPITIPLHRELKIGLLHQIVKDAGLTIEEFLAL